MRSTHNRAILAERAAQNVKPASPSTVGTNLAARPATQVTMLRSTDGGLRKGKRSKGRGPGAVARDSRGYRSDWSRSPYAPKGGWR